MLVEDDSMLKSDMDDFNFGWDFPRPPGNIAAIFRVNGFGAGENSEALYAILRRSR